MPPRDVAGLGQVFTPPGVVRAMLALKKNTGRCLEPSAGNGAFWYPLIEAVGMDHCVGLEIDSRHAPAGCKTQDFFGYPRNERFATIIGNPPYLRHQDIATRTRRLLHAHTLDRRGNLYLYFIEKCLAHLLPGGELIFITPRDFLKSTSATRLNHLLHTYGTFTHLIDLGDAAVFPEAMPNCVIWRFERGNLSHQTLFAQTGTGDNWAEALAAPPWAPRQQVETAGHLAFVRPESHNRPDNAVALRLGDLAEVKVGGVSGADALYTSAHFGNRDFVYSATVRSGKTRRMLWCAPGEALAGAAPPAALLPHRAQLIARKVRPFDARNWWEWGRGYPQTNAPRIYVNGRTRQARPFFLHECPHFDGAVLGIFPHRDDIDLTELCAALNAVDWAALGFVCDGRFLFTQRSLENAPLPPNFDRFAPPPSAG